MTRACPEFSENDLVYEAEGCSACANFEWKERPEEEQSVYHEESPDVEPHCKQGYKLERLVMRVEGEDEE